MPKPIDLAVARLDAEMLRIRKETEKELNKELKRVGDEVRDEVRTSSKPPFRTGKLRRSFKTSVRRKGLVSVYSNEPYAPVWEWGGEIHPRGVPIIFPETRFVTGTVEERGDDIADKLADAFNSIAHDNGFHGP